MVLGFLQFLDQIFGLLKASLLVAVLPNDRAFDLIVDLFDLLFEVFYLSLLLKDTGTFDACFALSAGCFAGV
jgi:hypothetical protein